MPPQLLRIEPVRRYRETFAHTTTLSRSRFMSVKMPYLTCKSRKNTSELFLRRMCLVPVLHLLPHEFAFNVLFKTTF